MSAVHFIQNMDGSQLSIDPQYYESCLTTAGEEHARDLAQRQQQQQLQQQQQQQQQQQPAPADPSKQRPPDMLDPFDTPAPAMRPLHVTESISAFAPVSATATLIDLPASLPSSGVCPSTCDSVC